MCSVELVRVEQMCKDALAFADHRPDRLMMDHRIHLKNPRIKSRFCDKSNDVFPLKSFPFQSIHAEQTMSWKSSNVSILNEVVNIIRKNVCCIHFFRKENHAILNIIINPTILTKTERRWKSFERQWRCRQQDAGSVHARSQASRALFKRNLIWNFLQKSTF